MDIGRVLARSIEIAWRYKVLWILGFIMALTGGGGGSGSNYNFNSSNFRTPIQPLGRTTVPQIEPGLVVGLLALAGCLLIVYLVLVLYFRFVARGALVTFVRGVEQKGAPTLGGAWREGRRYYGRLLGLGFLFNVPILIVSIIAILIALIPSIGIILTLLRRSTPGQFTSSDSSAIIPGILASIGLICCAVVCISVLHLLVHPVYEFAVRGIVLEETGTTEGLAKSYRRLRANLGPVALLYLILIGARIGWSLVTLVLAIPFGLLLVGVMAFAVTAFPTWTVILVAIAMVLPFALVLLFLEGLFQVFESTAWTEGYMAVLALPAAPPPIIPAASPDATA